MKVTLFATLAFASSAIAAPAPVERSPEDVSQITPNTRAHTDHSSPSPSFHAITIKPIRPMHLKRSRQASSKTASKKPQQPISPQSRIAPMPQQSHTSQMRRIFEQLTIHFSARDMAEAMVSATTITYIRYPTQILRYVIGGMVSLQTDNP